MWKSVVKRIFILKLPKRQVSLSQQNEQLIEEPWTVVHWVSGDTWASSGLWVLAASWTKEWVLHSNSEIQHIWTLHKIWLSYWVISIEKMVSRGQDETQTLPQSQTAKFIEMQKLLHLFLLEIGNPYHSSWIGWNYEINTKLWLVRDVAVQRAKLANV